MSKPSFDVSKAVGYKRSDIKVDYNRRDLILYALSIGIKEDNLKYLYELDPNFTAFPTYPLVLALKGDSPDVNLFSDRVTSGPTPGMPALDPNRFIHGEQSIEILRPVPLSGPLRMTEEVTAIWDKGSGTAIERTQMYFDAKGHAIAKLVGTTFVIGVGNWGGPKGPKPAMYAPPKGKQPDAVEEFKTDEKQALLYRLSGDYNPLHADPAIAPKVGFKKPILHGLCSYGISAHLILKAMGGDDPGRFKSISARFSKPVYPGDTLRILMWRSPEHSTASDDAIIFVTSVKERDEVVISNGLVLLRKKALDSKL